jgi:ferritin-like protein
MRNAERLHLTQFDKLRDEARRLKDLNVLCLPEIDEVVRMVGEAAALPTAGLDQTERVKIAVKAEKASAKASATLADLGL